MPLSLANEIRKGKASESQPWHKRETPLSRHQHHMLVGDREQTSTKRPNGCLRSQMVRWVKSLMKLPILKAAINMGLLRTHTTVRNNIKVERNSSRREYATVIRE
jgi:hypothetical protein